MRSKIIGIVQQFQVIENFYKFIKSLKEKACAYYVIPDRQTTGDTGWRMFSWRPNFFSEAARRRPAHDRGPAELSCVVQLKGGQDA